MSEKDIVFLNERNSVLSNSETMTTENAKSLFWCPWRRDPAGYRVLRSVAELEALRREYESRQQGQHTPDPPSDPWPNLCAWIDEVVAAAYRGVDDELRGVDGEVRGAADTASARERIEAAKERAAAPLLGDGVIFPKSEQVAPDYDDVLDDPREHPDGKPFNVLTEFLNCGLNVDAQDEEAASLEFTNRYGLLWTDRPVTLEDFRFCNESLREITASGETSPGTLAKLEKFAPMSTMQWIDGGPGGKAAPRFALANLWAAICYQLGQSFASDEFEWRACRYCPRLFRAGPGGDRKASAKSCCEECTIAYQNRKNNANRAEKTRQEREAISKRKCRRCGDQFSPTPKVPDYCRKPACLREHYRANQKARAASA